MRVLFTTQPADGHLNPMLGLSAALRRAGHDVVFATSPSFVPRVERRGERAVGVGVDWLESNGPIEAADPETDPTGMKTVFPRLFLRRVARAMADDLRRVVGDVRPDVVVRESVEFAGAAVAERCGLPWATFDFAFPADFRVLTAGDLDSDTELEALRAHVALDRISDSNWFMGALHISTLPERYRGKKRALQPRHVVIQPNAANVVDDAAVPDWVAGVRGAVYVSLGTIFTGYFPEVLNCAANGAAALGRSTVVTYGASADPETLDLPDAPHVRISEYVPQGPVLDRCAAAVTHGGTGTTIGALARGIPVVVIPLGADQFRHAEAVERLGAGVVLDHRVLTSAEVSGAVRIVLEDSAYRRRAAELAEDFASLPPPDHAVTALEDLAAQ